MTERATSEPTPKSTVLTDPSLVLSEFFARIKRPQTRTVQNKNWVKFQDSFEGDKREQKHADFAQFLEEQWRVASEAVDHLRGEDFPLVQAGIRTGFDSFMETYVGGKGAKSLPDELVIYTRVQGGLCQLLLRGYPNQNGPQLFEASFAVNAIDSFVLGDPIVRSYSLRVLSEPRYIIYQYAATSVRACPGESLAEAVMKGNAFNNWVNSPPSTSTKPQV